MIPPLTWQRTSCGQASGLSSCTVSGVRFCSSIPVGISLFLDTRTLQTSSSVWLNLQCLCPGFWTHPWSKETGGFGKERGFVQWNTVHVVKRAAALRLVMHIKVLDFFTMHRKKKRQSVCKIWRVIKNRVLIFPHAFINNIYSNRNAE